MQAHSFKFKGRDLLLATDEVLRLTQHALNNGPFSLSEREALSRLLEPMIYKITRAVMIDLEKPDENGGPRNAQSINEQYDQVLFQQSVTPDQLEDLMCALREPEGIDLTKLGNLDDHGYVSFKLAGPIHVLYDQSELIRVRAVVFGEKPLKKTMIETED